MESLFDYIIVGAGSAGCVLASELSRDPSVSVLLIEGGPKEGGLLMEMPRGLGKLMMPGSPYAWMYDVQKGGNHGNEVWMKGRTVGGSSSINGMIYARGFPSDYDRWEAVGCPGWGWRDMLPHLLAAEDHALGASDMRGVGGPLRITPHPTRTRLTEAVMDAAAQAGTPRVDDTNASPDGGIAYQCRTIWRGKRQSAAKAFLRPALARPNLTLITDTLVRRVVFEGARASGVEVSDATGTRMIGARREVILSAGAIESPKLLQLSGIGPANRLRALGIDIVHDAPGVGQNLCEHLYIQVQFRVSEGSLNREFQGVRLLGGLLRYLALKSGPMTHAAQELLGYIKSRPGLSRPDCQIGVGLYSMKRGPKGLAVDSAPGLTIGGYFMHPQSRGEMYITSADPASAPFINVNYLAEPEDRAASVALVRAIREIAAQPALKPFIMAELAPGPAVQSDDEILEAFYERGGTAFHVSGTCRMGSDALAVVDPACRVVGVDGLRVVDTSIFPELPSGNTNAPAMAAGRNAAGMIAAAWDGRRAVAA